jgi:hypothetical protein
MEPMLAAEPIESSEAAEPTEPIDKIDPADPIDKMDPAEPIDKIDPLEPMLRMDPDEPIERGAPSLLRMGSFSQPGRSSGAQVPAGGDAHPCSRLVTAAHRQVAAKCRMNPIEGDPVAVVDMARPRPGSSSSRERGDGTAHPVELSTCRAL